MVEMKEIGRSIAWQRHSANMTQMELAERLQVSHATVANWEQGLTMPDISTLPKLAEAFGSSIEQILGSQRGSRIVVKVAQGKTVELTQEEPVTVEEFRNVEPILKPQQIKAVSEALMPGDHLSELIDSVSYLSRNAANRVVTRFLEKNLPLAEHLPDILYNIDRQLADRIVTKVLESGEALDIGEVMPFVSRKTADKLAFISLEQGYVDRLTDFMPFVSRDAADKLVLQLLEQKNPGALKKTLPFVSRATAGKVFDIMLQNNENFAYGEVLPFVERHQVDSALLEGLQNDSLSLENLYEILPHTSREARQKANPDLASLLHRVMEEGSNIALEEIVRFLDEKLASKLVIYGIKNNLDFKLKNVIHYLSDEAFEEVFVKE